jgi:outer membrane receptor protein involved in Fe transport
MAALLLGYPTSGSYANNIAYALSQQYMALFVQDDWRVNSKLTFNLGLRWDYESPFTERYNRMVSGFCTTCTNPLQASVAGLPLYGGLTYANTSATPSRYVAPKEFGHIQPRFGAAYQATQKLVMRAGMGLFYFNTQD